MMRKRYKIVETKNGKVVNESRVTYSANKAGEWFDFWNKNKLKGVKTKIVVQAYKVKKKTNRNGLQPFGFRF